LLLAFLVSIVVVGRSAILLPWSMC
jgi:hypothetical protein